MIKNRNKLFAPSAIAAIALLMSGALWAQPRGGAGRFGPPAAGPGPPLAARLLAGPVGDRLELSDEQREQIRGVLGAHREANAPWHQDLRNLSAELEKAVEAEPLDEEAVRALARQVADIRVELAVSRARVAREVREVLTPDQRETLGEMRSQMKERREGFGGRGTHRRGPGR